MNILSEPEKEKKKLKYNVEKVQLCRLAQNSKFAAQNWS